MGDAVLRIRAEGGPEVARLLADVERLAQASGRRMRRSRDNELAGYRDQARRTYDDVARSDGAATRFRLRQLAMTDEARRRSETTYAIMLNRATRVMEHETGRRGELTEREKRQAEDLARVMVANHERAERQRTAATARAERERAAARQQFLAGAPVERRALEPTTFEFDYQTVEAK